MIINMPELLPQRLVTALCKLRTIIFDGSPAETTNLTPALARALLAISAAQASTLRVRELAQTLGIKESSASVLADRLVQAGLVGKKVYQGDGRVALLELLPTGAGLANSLQEHRLAKASRLLQVFSEKEQQEIISRLELMGTQGETP